MNRRPAGVVLVLLAIVGAVVMAGPGRRLAGTAATIDLPDPPAQGECLIDRFDRPDELPTDLARLAPRYGPCSGPQVVGEVVAVRHPVPGGLVGGWDDRIGCRKELLTHAGLVERNGSFGLAATPPGDPIDWQYSVAAKTVWVTQIPWAPRASSWAVCLVMPLDRSGSTPSIAGVFRGGRLPDVYSTCWMSRDVDAGMRVINCRQPHVAELIAIGRVDPSAVPEGEIRASCADQARLVMGRSDPTAGGVLTIHVDPDTTVLSARTRNLTCYLTAADDRELVGSVIGLGPTPVRFAG